MDDANNLFVVGIASSAGGIKPLMEMLELAQCHRSMCFIAVPHIARETESGIPAILERVSGFKTIVITHGMKLEHCRLYVLPPDAYVTTEGGYLRLSRRPSSGPNQSANVLFKSLAKSHGKNSIGVVLSGSAVGADGAEGVRAIHEAGGHTYVQDPATAEFPQMPEFAIKTGCADFVMSAKDIGQELSLVNWALG